MLPAVKAIHALTSLAYDNSQLGISIMQWLGGSPQPWHINGEIDGLQNSLPGCAPLWTFVRYDAPLEAPWLKAKISEDFNADVYIPLSTCRGRYGEKIFIRQSGSRSGEQVELHQVTLTISDICSSLTLEPSGNRRGGRDPN